jgi:hypothetical protein
MEFTSFSGITEALLSSHDIDNVKRLLRAAQKLIHQSHDSTESASSDTVAESSSRNAIEEHYAFVSFLLDEVLSRWYSKLSENERNELVLNQLQSLSPVEACLALLTGGCFAPQSQRVSNANVAKTTTTTTTSSTPTPSSAMKKSSEPSIRIREQQQQSSDELFLEVAVRASFSVSSVFLT